MDRLLINQNADLLYIQGNTENVIYRIHKLIDIKLKEFSLNNEGRSCDFHVRYEGENRHDFPKAASSM